MRAHTACRSTCSTWTPTGSSSTGSTPTSSGTPSRFGDRKQFVADLAEARHAGCRSGSCPTSTRPRRSSSTPSARATSCGAPTAAWPPSRRRRPRTGGCARSSTSPTRRPGGGGRRCTADFLDDGVAVFKTDFGEALPDDVALFDGTPPNQAHNLYPLRYNGAVSDAIREFTDRPPLVWGRSGWAGFAALPRPVGRRRRVDRRRHAGDGAGRTLLRHERAGVLEPRHRRVLRSRADAGALRAVDPARRALTADARARPATPRAVGLRGRGAARSAATGSRLRYSLLPYLWQVAQRVRGERLAGACARSASTTPTTAWPGASTTASCSASDLLVVPVFDDADAPVRRTFYVPEGRWYDLEDGHPFHGSGLPHRRGPAGPHAAARP